MKITDIKPFVSTDRKVHVALTDGGSKDGFLATKPVTDDEGVRKTVVTLKGDRGRPSVLVPSLIDSITWHPKDLTNTEATPVAKKIVKRTSAKKDCGCSGKLLCKSHFNARKGAEVNGSEQVAPHIDRILVDVESLQSANDLAKVIRQATIALLAMASLDVPTPALSRSGSSRRK